MSDLDKEIQETLNQLGEQVRDDMERELELKISRVYAEAVKDIEEKLRDFTERYKAKEAIYRRKLKDGEITQEQYNNWFRGQLFQSKQWIAKRDQLTEVLYHVNDLANQIIEGEKYNLCAKNANYMSYALEKKASVNFGFELYDQNTVINLIRNNPSLLPLQPPKRFLKSKDKAWNRKIINGQVLQGIIQGERLDQIAKRIARATGSRNRNQILTTARTAMTSAQNAGRQITLHQAEDKGIRVHKEWMATLDEHTRVKHRRLDGQQRPIDQPFSIDGIRIMFPGDPQAPPSMTYNCRCTLVGDLDDYPEEYERYDNIDGKPVKDMTYEDWYEHKGKTHKVANKVIDTARAAEKTVTRDLKFASSKGAGHLEGLDFRFKGRGSLERKIVDKSTRKRISQEVYARQVTDALRYTNISKPETLVEDFITMKNTLEGKGYTMVEVVNTLKDTDVEYRGINTLVRTPKGYTFELQFHTPQSLEIKEVNHLLYEEQRLSITPESRKTELGREMLKNASNIVTPNSIEKIDNKLLDKEIKQW